MKKALLVLALLVPFFSFATIFSDGSVLTLPPETVETTMYNCNIIGSGQGTVSNLTECSDKLLPYLDVKHANNCLIEITRSNQISDTTISFDYKVGNMTSGTNPYCAVSTKKSNLLFIDGGVTTVNSHCPPVVNPTYTYPVTDSSGDIIACADPSNIAINDSCNYNDVYNVQVTEQNACYTKSDGSVCAVTAVDVGGGNQVYIGSEGNCYSLTPDPDVSNNSQIGQPPVDQNCVNNGGLLACPEDPDNVCTNSGSSFNGSPILDCQQGCGYVNDQFICYDIDTDSDGLPDYNDPDIDGDGIPNGDDLDADGDGQDDPINSGSGTGGGGTQVDIDLSPVVSELKKLNANFEKSSQNFDFKTDKNIDGEIEKYKTEMEVFGNKTASDLGYVESVTLGESALSNVPKGSCRNYDMPVGNLGIFNYDLCFVSDKAKPFLAYVFGFLTAFYVFITVNETIRRPT